jgi:hypothetical protein
MSLAQHSTNSPHYNLEEYSYHLEQASHYLQYAEQAQEALEEAMNHFRRHNAWLKQHASKNFIA